MATPISQAQALGPKDLRAQYPEELLPASTADIEPLDRVTGQDRALEAIAFGLAVDAEGYNIAVSGPPSSGRNTAVHLLVDEAAAAKPPVQDWCYLHNFDEAYRPRSVALPSGLGDDLRRELAQLVDVIRKEIPKAFESDSYQERSRQTLAPFTTEREEALGALRRTADEHGFLVNVTPMGFVSAPRGRDGAPIPAEQINQLSEDQRQELDERGRRVQESVSDTVRDLRRLDTRAREAIETLDKDVTRFVVGPLLDDLRGKYPQPDLVKHFNAIEADILANIETLKAATPQGRDQTQLGPPGVADDERERLFRRYEVNLFITHGDEPAKGAPVIDERQPTYYNLFGRLDYQPRFGSLTTDFTLIRPGALHTANGGYLILQAPDLLSDPRSWIKLKRSLKSKQIRVEDIGEVLTPLPTVNLVPEPIPLDLKVILVGPQHMLAMLEAVDPDFSELFKIRAEFEPDAANDESATRSYASFVRRACDVCSLRQFERGALVEVLRYGNRLAGRQDRLSTRYGTIADLSEEANQLAHNEEATVVTAGHVRSAIAARTRRSDLIPVRLRRLIAEGTLHIETTGAVMGQVNGLAVYQVGSHAFGTPTRITCRTGAGSLGVVNIEREVERSGAIHSKGVLVLSGYLMGTFGRERPLSFSASVTFEQSYDEVDGDSASSAELYAILTSLAQVPMRQDIAVTGSVDQFGNIQPVGGVTQKVEGFFDVCREVGLTGSQGVVIPAANTINLTLREDVVRAVAEGQFQLWAVSRVEEGLELLTNMPAGTVDADHKDPPDTIFGKVMAALKEMRPMVTAPATVEYGAAERGEEPPTERAATPTGRERGKG